MQKIKILFFLSVWQLFGSMLQAQQGPGKTVFGETMRSNGRIYVVVAVMLTILTGLVLYLVRLDKKISKLEKEK
jgi:hypothetical protein